MQKKISTSKGIGMIIIIVVIAAIGVLAFWYFLRSEVPIADTSSNPDVKIAGWKTYKNEAYGFQFQYPEKFSTPFADFQTEPKAIISLPDDNNIKGDECYEVTDGSHSPYVIKPKVVIHQNNFCVSESIDRGAGQSYNEYDYTVRKNGNVTYFVTLQYIVHTSNDCGVYGDSSQYQACKDFMAHYDEIIGKSILNSVATFKFIPK